MTSEQDTSQRIAHGRLLPLALVAPIVGALTGLVCAIFRITLEHADRLRDTLITWAHGHALEGFLILTGVCATAAAVAAFLVRAISPHAAGSGIPHAEAVLRGQLEPAPYTLVPVKFIGGVLAIGSGLALGREGPSVQMGASIAFLTGRLCRMSWSDCRVLLAAGAGAGLATAFNAPIAGAIFVLEELVQRFEHRVAIAALAASATAIAVARQFIGNMPDFQVEPVNYAQVESLPLFLVLGTIAGLIAVAYNRGLLAILGMAERLKKLPVEVRAWLIGAMVGILAWFAPDLVGGGDNITQSTLSGRNVLTAILIAFGIRFVLSIASYAAGTPGGLFAPLLVLGAQMGLMFGSVCRTAFPTLGIQPEAFALVGMAAFFTGVVRAPVTGIVLVTEMTANVTMLLPMLGACFIAMLVPTLLGNVPIYEALREGTLRRERNEPGKGRGVRFGPSDGGWWSGAATPHDEQPTRPAPDTAPRRPTWPLILLAITLAAIVALSIRPVREPILRAAGWALVVNETVAPADIIVLSLDSGGAGALEAAELVRGGIANRVAVFTDPPSGEDLEFIRRGLPYEDASARQIRQLRSLGVTDILQIPRADEGTEGESTILPAWCREHHIQSMVFIAARDHSRRARRVLERAMKDQGVRVAVQPARYSSFDPDRWWQTRGGMRIGIIELQKLLLDLLRHPMPN